jgi:hypothetical protein
MDAANLPADFEPFSAEEITTLRGARRDRYLARRAEMVASLAARGVHLDAADD